MFLSHSWQTRLERIDSDAILGQKSQNDESPAVYLQKFTPIMARNNFHCL